MVHRTALGGEIPLISLAADEEPDGPGPHIIVLHALSGEFRVLIQTDHAIDMPGARSIPGGACDARETAIRAARETAKARGLSQVYIREDG